MSQIPLAVLSAVLMMVAWNMSELDNFRHLLRAPKSDIAVLLTAFILTVLVDLTVAVGAGLLLALLLFWKKRKKYASLIKELDKPYTEESEEIEKKKLSPDVQVFEMMGPFFFGAVDSIKHILTNLEAPPKIFLLQMRKVPFIDASGMHALEDLYYKCKKEGTVLRLKGVKDPVFKSLQKFGLVDLIGREQIARN